MNVCLIIHQHHFCKWPHGPGLNMEWLFSMVETNKTPLSSGRKKYWQTKCLLFKIHSNKNNTPVKNNGATFNFGNLDLIALKCSRVSPHFRDEDVLIFTQLFPFISLFAKSLGKTSTRGRVICCRQISECDPYKTQKLICSLHTEPKSSLHAIPSLSK